MKFDIEFAMEAARGLPINTVCRILERYTGGVNYRGCGKRYIFQRLAEGLDVKRDNGLVHRKGRDPEYREYTWRGEWWGSFVRDLRDEPRPKPASQRRKEKKAAAERERQALLKEAEGWTKEAAIKRVRALDKRIKRKREKIDIIQYQVDKLEAENFKMLRILDTIDPEWRF